MQSNPTTQAPQISDTEALRLLFDMVATPSVSRDEAGFAARFAERLAELGLRTRIDAAGNLIAECGTQTATPHVALVGHIDTVPGSPRVHDDGTRIWGRGSVDAKAPFAAFVAAAVRYQAAAERGDVAPLAISIVGCVEEEVPSSKGAHFLVEHGLDFDGAPIVPDFLIVGEPSGSDGITLGYKGHIAARLTLIKATCHGAHDEASAGELAVAMWTHVAAQAQVANPPTASTLPESASPKSPWDAGAPVEGKPVKDRLGASAPTEAPHSNQQRPMFERWIPRLNSIATHTDGAKERAELHLSLRIPPGPTTTDAFAWLERVARQALQESNAGQATLTFERDSAGLPAWSGPRTTPLTRALSRAILEQGARPNFKVKSGTADLNLLAPLWGCPAVAYGPGDAALDHRPDEHIEHQEFLRGVRVLEAALAELARA